MLEGAGSYCKLQCFLLRPSVCQSVNDAGAEAVASAHAVNDGHYLVAAADVEVLAVVDHGLPSVVRGAEALAQGGHEVAEAELLHRLAEDVLVAFGIRPAAFHVCIGAVAKARLCVFFVADAYINVLHEGAHDALCLLGRPEFLAIVEVAADGCSGFLCRDACLPEAQSRAVAQGWCDAAPVEPVGTTENLVEVEVIGRRLADAAVCPVVDDLAGTQAAARLQIIDAKALSSAHDVVCVHSEAAQAVDGSLTYLACGNLADEISFVAIILQADGHVCLAAAVVHVEAVGLDEPAVARCGETQHDLSHCHYLCHCVFSLFVC